MGRKVQNKMKSICPVSLVIVGWAAFALGFMVDSSILKLMLLSAARVLP